VTRDPAEGVDAHGYLVTGAALAKVAPVYRPILDDCVSTLTATFADRLDGLYLYGSVATGQARPPDSDLDLLALWTSTVDDNLVRATATALSTRHSGAVREVGLARATLDSITEPADRCFLKHYCVPLTGYDRRTDLAPCTPSRALADGFNGDVVPALRSIVDDAVNPAVAARKAARRLLLAVATVESVSHATWSTDRDTGAALLTRHHREWTDVAANAVELAAGRGNPDGAGDLVALADWLGRHP
jgi:hypothetical protein